MMMGTFDYLVNSFQQFSRAVAELEQENEREAYLPRGWDTIETAPKTGQEIILADDHEVIGSAYWSEKFPGGNWVTKGGQLLKWNHSTEPTMWQRMPPHPRFISKGV